MTTTDSRVTIHMAASLDGFIARKDGRVDWLETSDEFADGETLDPEFAGRRSSRTRRHLSHQRLLCLTSLPN